MRCAHLVEQRGGFLEVAEAQVARRQHERQLDIAGGPAVDFFEFLDGLCGPSVGDQGLSEQPSDGDAARVRGGECREGRYRGPGLPRLEIHRGQRHCPAGLVGRGCRGASKGRPGVSRAAIGHRHGAQEQPPSFGGGPIPALRQFALTLTKADFSLRDGGVEQGRRRRRLRVGRTSGKGPGDQHGRRKTPSAARHEGRSSVTILLVPHWQNGQWSPGGSARSISESY